MHGVLLVLVGFLVAVVMGHNATQISDMKSLKKVDGLRFNQSESELVLEFEFEGEQFVFRMEKVQGMYDAEHQVTTTSGKTLVHSTESLCTYHSHDSAGRISVGSVIEGRFTGLFELSDSRWISIDDGHVYRSHLGGDRFRELTGTDDASGSFVSEGGIALGSCGEDGLLENVEYIVSKGNRERKHKRGRVLGNNDGDEIEDMLTLPMLECFPESDLTHQITTGFVLDKAYVDYFSSPETALQFAESSIRRASAFYERFFNIVIRVGRVVVVDSDRVSNNYLDKFVTCPSKGASDKAEIGDALDNLYDYTRTLPNSEQMAHYHLFSGCTFKNNVVGLAYLDTHCDTRGYNTGVSNMIIPDPHHVFAHEFGHASGAIHSFEDGIGKTGGLMDYGSGKLKTKNGKWSNEVGFRLERQEEMCDGFTRIQECKFFKKYIPEAPKCGDKMLHDSEECECLNGSTNCGLCKNCKLQSKDVECGTNFIMRLKNGPSEGSTAESACCQNNKLLTADTECPGNRGHCALGKCVNRCDAYYGYFDLCGTTNDSCRQKCQRKTDTWCTSAWRVQTGSVRSHLGDLPDGSKCATSDGSIGSCQSGYCIETIEEQTTEEEAAPGPAPSPSPSDEDDDEEVSTEDRITLPHNTGCGSIKRQDCCKYKDATGQLCMPSKPGSYYKKAGRQLVHCKPYNWIVQVNKQNIMDDCAA